MKFLILIVFFEVFGPSAFSTSYGDDGLDYRYLVQEVCSGDIGNPLKGTLQREYLNGQPTFNWRWVVKSGSEKWEIYAYSQVYGFSSRQLTVYYPPEYNQNGNVYSYTGSSNYSSSRAGQNVYLRGAVVPNIQTQHWPNQFDFRLSCHPKTFP